MNSHVILKNKEVIKISQEDKVRIIKVLAYNTKRGSYIIMDIDLPTMYLITISEIAAVI